jgi:LacI family transcriptional regulator
MVRLVDIAKNVGVSVTTVSYVLSGKGKQERISEKTRQRIIAETKKLNYRKNAMGVQLKKGRSRQIAFLADQFDCEYVFSIYSGLTERALLNNYSCRMQNFSPLRYKSDNINQIRGFFSQILESRPEAVIIYYIQPHTEELIQSCHEMNIPVCRIEHRQHEGADLLIYSDSQDGASLMVDYLYKRGHREIGFLYSTYPFAVPICNGFMNRIKHYELSIRPEQMLTCDSQQNTLQIYTWLENLLDSGQMPTAICCDSDFQAVTLLIAALRLGLRIPEELSIFGFGGLNFTHSIHPQITTVQKNYQCIGSLAAEKLLQLLDGTPLSVSHYAVPCHIQEGQTVANLNAGLNAE